MNKIIYKVIALFLIICCQSSLVYAKEEPDQLYAQSAVLMDAESGRILFDKNGTEIKPMASTTKIMTCIVTLENCDLNEVVTASASAAKQPKVHLGMRTNQQFLLKDLLYSLMLESHNDSAVAIAEHVGGSVEGFADMMNEKSKSIGCKDTFFITPNGLDAEVELADENGQLVKKVHSTTATDLAKILRYCIKKSPKSKEFLEITRTGSHSFTDYEQKSSYLCNNHNAFLTMMDGALTGKTGFTGGAGYCYVGALERDGKTYIVALLACGWPNNKSYKWSDTKKLMEYGIQNYDMKSTSDISLDTSKLKAIPVVDGQTSKLGDQSYINLQVDDDTESRILINKEEQIKIIYQLPKRLKAPIYKGNTVGKIQFYVGDELWSEFNVNAQNEVKKINFQWCFKRIYQKILMAG
ncbi:D-alanyl-D-alanine carboxypeptidase family protein [Lachnospiraceae bacterium LCP25S3_G4]